MEEELLKLSKMADEIYEYLRDNKDKTDEEMMHECPALYMTTFFARHNEDNAKLIVKMVEERRKNDERNRKSGASRANHK